ncbi:cytochrome P450 9e2-like [Coccinella septempunctata]|uniref:cytochrome P450 9e2-like n=1 Tax=Coccinella septempunctata TaxID=41139 RepID=UPI001D060B25|nr:cytochrome P450 9e2-like [Coccinella septempunctata]
MFLLIVIILIISFILYEAIALLPSFLYWKRKKVSYISLQSTLKRMIFMDKSYFEMVRDDCKKFAGKRYFGSYLSIYPALYVTDIDLIKQMFVKDFEHFTDRFDLLNAQSDPIINKNLLAARGKQWKELRTTVSPVFTNSKMKAMFVLIAESARKFVEHFDAMDGDTIEVEMKEAFCKYTNDVIASCAFGAQCDSLKNPKNEIYLAGKIVTTTTPFKVLNVLFVTLFPKFNRIFGLNGFPKGISHVFKRIITQTIRTRENEGIIRPDLIHQLMEARRGKLQQENSNSDEVTGFATVSESKDLKSKSTLEITDDVITAQAIIFFMAGYEASSTLLSFLSHELATNPDVQQKLIREIDDHLSYSDSISFEMVTKMKYLDQVVTEALRKWPTAFILFRKCTKEYTIQPKQEGEFPLTLQKGALTIIPFVATHYNEEYFENPDAFIPERFDDENKKNVIPGSYTPFGIGPRNCIGSRFALLEIKCLVANILSKFEFQVTEKTNIPLKLHKTLPMSIDGGVILSLKRRNVIKE